MVRLYRDRMGKRALWLLVPVAVGLSAFTWANTPTRDRATRQYTCELGRRIIAIEDGKYIQLMFAGRPYELTWTSSDTAKGQGLEWRTGTGGASLRRASSGHAMASGCTERAPAL
jgi:hypothetical protein